MKPLCLIIFLLAFVASTFAQSTETPHLLTKDDYLRKSRHQRTAAWVLSGAGLAGMLGAMGAGMSHMTLSISLYGNPQPQAKNKSYTGLFVAGAAALVTGIGFAIAAGHNKRQARSMDATLLMKAEQAPVVQTAGRHMQAIPALALRLRLR